VTMAEKEKYLVSHVLIDVLKQLCKICVVGKGGGNLMTLGVCVHNALTNCVSNEICNSLLKDVDIFLIMWGLMSSDVCGASCPRMSG